MYLCKNNLIAFMAIGLLLIGLGLMNSCKGKKAADTGLTQLEKAPDIKERLEQFSPTELAIDESILNEEQKLVLDKLIQASRHIDTIFWKQASSNGLSLKAALEISEDPADKDYLEYLKIHYGPFDRLDAHKPFIGTEAKPPGAALYPPDMTKEEFQQFISDHPESKELFESPYTVICRKEGELTAVPYNEEYREDLEPAAALLKEAAEITTNAELKKYLNEQKMRHIRSKIYHPMTQGKIERYFRSMKNLILLDLYYSPEELRTRIGEWVDYYNNHRYHEAIDNVTPSDKYFGRDREILEQRKKIKAETMKQRRKWNQKMALIEGIN